MAFRFGPCELDEARRSLTANGREVALQPRVFDLLCYLVRHRDRVVPKDELLDTLWPGTIVIDNALQRVVSLARAALAEAGVPNAVRTYARHGYRFCFDGGCESGPGAEPAARIDGPGNGSTNAPLVAPTLGPTTTGGDVEAARAACLRNDWAAACELYAAADAQGPLPADDVEPWGRAAICAGVGPSVVPALERTVALCQAADDAPGAVRSMLLLVQIRTDHNQSVIARGLLQRAARLLEGRGDSVERGHFEWMSARMALGSGNTAGALAHADEACRIGRALRDADVECLGLAYRGHALMGLGHTASGIAQHEEAAAMIRVGGVCSWAVGWALCSILYVARYSCDWQRAAQFADSFIDWSRECRMPAFPGTCRIHRAAVLGVRGELQRAASEVREAAELVAQAAPWAEGDAYCVLGDIQLAVGDFDAAEASFRQAHALGWDPQPGLARLHLATGRPELARRELERALEEADWTLRERRGQLLCLLVQAAVACGDTDRAREALRVLDTDAQMLATEALQAMHACAQAAIALHDGEFGRAAQHLRRSVRHWREAGSPVGEVDARLRLAECLLADRDASGAELELHAVESALASAALAHRTKLASLREALAAAR